MLMYVQALHGEPSWPLKVTWLVPRGSFVGPKTEPAEAQRTKQRTRQIAQSVAVLTVCFICFAFICGEHKQSKDNRNWLVFFIRSTHVIVDIRSVSGYKKVQNLKLL